MRRPHPYAPLHSRTAAVATDSVAQRTEGSGGPTPGSSALWAQEHRLDELNVSEDEAFAQERSSVAKPQPWRPQRPVAPFDAKGGTAHVGAFKAEAERRAAAAAAIAAWSLEDGREDGCVGLGGWLR